MKKSILLGVLGWVATVTPSFGVGWILLDNYESHGLDGGPPVTYGIGVPANGVSGPLGVSGAGLSGDWTAGIYFAFGTLNIVDPAGNGMPNAALTLGTGTGSTAAFDSLNAGYTPGEFASPQVFIVGGTGAPTITVELVAYPTAAGSYAAAAYRAHSAPFTMATVSIPGIPPLIGDYMPAFSVGAPEPTTLILGGLGGLSLWLMRRKRT